MASPASDRLDREKLLKLLALAASDHDSEALSALRRVQRMLRDADMTWEGLFAGPAAKSWTQALDLSTQYFVELRRRRGAEKNAEHWQSIARAQQSELQRLKAAQAETARAEPPPKPIRPAPIVTAHPLIDRLLAANDLEPSQRARIEAIASWYRKTNALTKAEEADLETFSRQLEMTG